MNSGLIVVVGAALVGGVDGVVERLALSSGAFLPPMVLFLYVRYCTESNFLVPNISRVHNFEFLYTYINIRKILFTMMYKEN